MGFGTESAKHASDHRAGDRREIVAHGQSPAGPLAAHGNTATPNIALIVHQGLRGRYTASIILGLMIGGAAALATYKFVKPTYKSEGLLRIAYSRPPIMPGAEDVQSMPYDMFMQSQKTLLTSRRMVDMAVLDPVWKTMGRQVPPDPDYFYSTHMKVDVSPRVEYIAISVTDTDPGTAAAAVNAVINSYQQLFDSQRALEDHQRTGYVQNELNTLHLECDGLEAQLREGEKEYGTTDLSMFYDDEAARVNKLKDSLDEIRMAIAVARSNAPAAVTATGTAAPATQPTTASAAQMTPQQIASVDPVMQGYWAEQSRLEDALQQLLLAGLGEQHKQVLMARGVLEAARRKTSDYADMYRQFHAATAQNLGDPRTGPVQTTGKSLEELRQNEATLADLYEKCRKKMVEDGLKHSEMRRIRETLQAKRERETKFSQQLNLLQSEGQLGSRLTVMATGEVALAPERDRRPMIAAAGGLAGSCLPAGAFFLVASFGRRYRYSDEAESVVGPIKTPLLGVLPELGVGSEAEEFSAAAHSVHQLRVSLCARKREQGGASIYLITSAISGEGKTSLAMSLGLSCTASRLRTLVIDGDLVARKLTAALEARDLEGLHEAALTGTLRHRIRKTDAGLFVLPAGNASPTDACSLSSGIVRRLLDEARQHFDMILIDSGPILGSVEAAVFAHEVDGVIFAISRGQNRETVNRGLTRLRSLGAKVVGCIFNRARPEDFDRSPSGSSARSSVREGTAGALVRQRMGRYDRFGLLVQAVAAGMPAIGQN